MHLLRNEHYTALDPAELIKMRAKLRNTDSENSDVLCEKKWTYRLIPTTTFLLTSIMNMKSCLKIMYWSKDNEYLKCLR